MKKVKTPQGFCVLPWLMRYVHNDGLSYLCSMSSANPNNSLRDKDGHKLNILNEGDFEALSDSSDLKEIRQKMLKGEWSRQCLVCKESESFGPLSHRIQKNQEFQGHIPKILSSTNAEGGTTHQRERGAAGQVRSFDGGLRQLQEESRQREERHHPVRKRGALEGYPAGRR